MNKKRPVSALRRTKPAIARFVICIQNEGHPVSLEKRKIYRVLPDAAASAHNLIRVIDESGEDYLYPLDWFIPVSLPQTVANELALAT